MTVILSGVAAARSAAATQSKDPNEAFRKATEKRHSHDGGVAFQGTHHHGIANEITVRIP
jgi:hypothetical protein